MRPLFTVHAGEYLVGREIERRFKNLRVWIPSRDTGTDLLVTNASEDRIASLQVKFSKDHLGPGKKNIAIDRIKSGGWWTFNREKLAGSTVDYWVLVLCQFTSRDYDYLTVPPSELLRRYDRLERIASVLQSYFWVTRKKKCWETRGLAMADQNAICDGKFNDPTRDFSEYLNHWRFAERVVR